MTESFLGGAVAGYAIAIPVGAIAILIIDTSLLRGFWAGFAAGSGAATADLVYATVAATAGTALAAILSPFSPVLKWTSALFLIGFGAWGLARVAQARRSGQSAVVPDQSRNFGQTYITLLALTLLNPATIAYFAALILGLNIGARLTSLDKVLFVLGAFLASWSWQTLLAAAGALGHRRLSPSFRNVTSLIGNLMIIGLGLRILL
jgi:threonine/homoserine/homoserine lactone efflux protein